MTPKVFNPRPYQVLAVDHLCAHPRAALWAGMGMGKTTSALVTLDALSLTDDVYPALVCAPKRVAMSTWPAEAAKWTFSAGLRVSPILGSRAEREAALRTRAEIYTINYDNLPWLVEHVGDDWPFRTVVADESTRLKGFRLRQGSVRAAAIGKVAHKHVARWINLTGTPAPNGLIDLWGQTHFIDAGQRLGRTFRAFTDRWFNTTAMPGGYAQIAPRDHAQDEIQARLRDVCLTLDPADWFDLREPVHVVIRVSLPQAARARYAELEAEMYTTIGDGEVEAFNAASRTIKCLQLANGAVYLNPEEGESASGRWAEVHDAKLQALESLIEEQAGAPLLVAYHFRHDKERLLKAFPRARELDDKPQTLADWNAGRIPVLLAHPASAGHGLNLQDGGNAIAFFGHWWDLELRQQIIERVGSVRQAQSGHDRPVYVYDIVAEDTVDETVIERLKTKSSVQDALRDAMKRERGRA